MLALVRVLAVNFEGMHLCVTSEILLFLSFFCFIASFLMFHVFPSFLFFLFCYFVLICFSIQCFWSVIQLTFKNKHIRQLFILVALNLTEWDSDRGIHTQTCYKEEENSNHQWPIVFVVFSSIYIFFFYIFFFFNTERRGHAENTNVMITIKEKSMRTQPSERLKKHPHPHTHIYIHIITLAT